MDGILAKLRSALGQRQQHAPFRLYKHFTHEGGIASPFIVRWPDVIHATGGLSHQLQATLPISCPRCSRPADATYPKEFKSPNRFCRWKAKKPAGSFPGQIATGQFADFLGTRGQPRRAHGTMEALVSRYPGPWELYDMKADRTELHDLASQQPDRVKDMSALYDQWAQRWRRGAARRTSYASAPARKRRRCSVKERISHEAGQSSSPGRKSFLYLHCLTGEPKDLQPFKIFTIQSLCKNQSSQVFCFSPVSRYPPNLKSKARRPNSASSSTTARKRWWSPGRPKSACPPTGRS